MVGQHTFALACIASKLTEADTAYARPVQYYSDWLAGRTVALRGSLVSN